MATIGGDDTMDKHSSAAEGGPIMLLEYEAFASLDSTGIVTGDATRAKATATGVQYVLLVGNEAADGSGTNRTVLVNSSGQLISALGSLPAGNLGQQVMAASLSVVPASDITDGTYIGDIKFGEALPTGANIIGTVLLPVAATTTTGAESVSVDATTTQVIGANAARVCLTMTNDSDEVIYLGFGEAAVMNKGRRLNVSGGSYEINSTNMFTGVVNAICASGSKILCVGEW